MGLISTEVWVGLEPKTIKWYEEKGYEIPRWIDNRGRLKVKRGTKILVKIKDLPDSSNVKVDVQCDGCKKLLEGIPWDNYNKYIKEDGKYYCQKCSNNLFGNKNKILTKIKNGKSFGQWCYENLPREISCLLLSRWDENKNIDRDGNLLTPYDITFSSSGINGKGYWFKCLDHPEHESELKNISYFTSNQKENKNINCNQCDSFGHNHPDLIKYLVNKEIAYKIQKGSGKEVSMKCPDCGYKKELVLRNLIRQGFGCPKCGDGISYPNKFMFNVLDQIKSLNKIEDFETEKTFDWLKFNFKNKIRKGFIDFYFRIDDKGYGIEMDGSFHTKDNSMSGQTKEESKYIDNEKDRLCQENDVEVIRIDCEKSELQYIKNSLMQSELPKLLNFNEGDIDWLKCHEYGCNNLVKIVCDIWRSGLQTTNEIENQLKLSKTTIIRYLKQGVELGWGDYDPRKERNKNNVLNSKKVICLTTNKIFNSILEASKEYKTNKSSISKCCKGKMKSAGKHPETGEKLIWEYNN